MNNSYALFHIEGGLGKHVAATAIAKTIKNNYPERNLLVVCAHPEVFINLPFVDKVFRIGNTPYFYNDYINGKDTLIFRHEPYFTTEHIHKQLPLIENWAKLYNLEYLGEKPEIVFNLRHKQIAINKWSREKPIAVIQTNGGPLEGQEMPYSWTRDMPYNIASQIVQNLINEGYHVMQICRHELNVIHGAEAITHPMSNMELFGLLQVAQKRIFIDSAMQHAAAALGLKSTVLWVGTSPTIFGYDLHDNLQATLPDNINLPDSYLFDYQFTGIIHECPYIDNIEFDMNEVMTSISNQ